MVERNFNPYDRETFKQVTAQQALDLLRRTILPAQGRLAARLDCRLSCRIRVHAIGPGETHCPAAGALLRQRETAVLLEHVAQCHGHFILDALQLAIDGGALLVRLARFRCGSTPRTGR